MPRCRRLSMKKIPSNFLVIVCVLTLAIVTNAQQTGALIINIAKPSVFISFVKKGQMPPLYQGDSDQRIWLRLTNNTRLSLFTCDSSVPQEYGEAGLRRAVYRSTGLKRVLMESLGEGGIDSCHVREIKSGKAILFSLPAEELQTGMIIQVPFNYGWTGNWKADMFASIESVVGFGADQLYK